jgi:PST family polysaccharide transporter
MKIHFSLIEKRGLAFLFSGNIISMLIASIGGLCIAQFYGPSSFGEYVVILGISTILTPFLTLGLDLEIPQISNDQEANDLAINTISRAIKIGVTFSLPLIASSLILNQSRIGDLLLSLALGFILATVLAVYAIGTQINLRLGKFRNIATRGIIQNTVLIFIQASLGLISKGYLNLVTGELLGRSLGVVSLLPKPFARLVVKNLFVRSHFRQTRKSRVNSWNVLSQLSDNITSSFLVFSFTLLFGSSVAGSIALSLKIALLPIAIFGIPLGQMILSNSSRQVRSGHTITFRQLTTTILKVILVGLVSNILIFVSAPFVAVVMGNEWYVLSDSLRILSLGITLQLLWNSFGSLYYVAKKWKEYAMLKLVNVFFLILLTAWAKILDKTVLEFLSAFLVINVLIQLFGLLKIFRYTFHKSILVK